MHYEPKCLKANQTILSKFNYANLKSELIIINEKELVSRSDTLRKHVTIFTIIIFMCTIYSIK